MEYHSNDVEACLCSKEPLHPLLYLTALPGNKRWVSSIIPDLSGVSECDSKWEARLAPSARGVGGKAVYDWRFDHQPLQSYSVSLKKTTACTIAACGWVNGLVKMAFIIKSAFTKLPISIWVCWQLCPCWLIYSPLQIATFNRSAAHP